MRPTTSDEAGWPLAKMPSFDHHMQAMGCPPVPCVAARQRPRRLERLQADWNSLANTIAHETKSWSVLIVIVSLKSL